MMMIRAASHSRLLLLSLAVLVVALARCVQSRPAGGDADAFVTVSADGKRFEVAGGENGTQVFTPVGFNLWEVVEAASCDPADPVPCTQPSGSPITGRRYVDTVFADARDSGFTTVRVFAHGVTPEYASMDSAGRPVENMLVGLDYVVAAARENGLRLIVSFVSNWSPAGGVDSFAGNLGFEHNAFFQEQAVKDAYKAWVSGIVLRNNTITGVPYRDDPTIFAYNLINEPVCRDCPPYALQAWIQDMAAFVKGMDSAHLLTVGEEGYSSLTEDRRVYNPGSENNRWADTFGQDFMTDHSFGEIDFATMHAWVDNWKEEHLPELGLAFFVDWIEGHVEMADELGKPLILEEFGKTGRDVRDAYFKAAYDAVLDSVARSRSLVGALYWQYYVDGQRADWYPEDPERGPWGVTRADVPHVLTEELAGSLME